MSRMFAATPQTPANVPRTPSWTPTRSAVKRRPSNTPSMAAPKRTASCCSKSQPTREDDFYDLRTRQVPLSNSISELWEPYGIHESHQAIDKQNRLMDERGKRSTWKLSMLTTGLKLFCLMILSAFMGALCFVHMQQYFLKTNSHSTALLKEPDRLVDLTSHLHKLENAVLHLSEKVKYMDEHFRKLQESVGSEVISSPQRGILEELLIADLACAGNLGSVLATPDTTTVTVPATLTVLGLPFSVQVNHRPPHTAIQGLIQEVGDCWPFQGSRGRLVLKLHRRSLVTGVSISHIPLSISVSRDVSSAPRLFQVLIHQQEDDLQNGQILGEFEYKTSGAWRQTFPLKSLNSKEDLVKIIEFSFLTNHGHPNYTCVYRVHVHGETP